MPIELGPLAAGFAGGGAVGGVIGFALKKFAKFLKTLLIVLVGLQLAVFAVAEKYGLISVDWAGVQTAFVDFMGVASERAAGTAPTVMDTVIASAPVSGGFLGGVALGFKFG